MGRYDANWIYTESVTSRKEEIQLHKKQEEKTEAKIIGNLKILLLIVHQDELAPVIFTFLCHS